jgi:two-component sensor histidine kinase
MRHKAAEHHKKAEEYLVRAAYHHGKAAEEIEGHETALDHGQMARVHRLQGAAHAEKALKAHIEHIHLLMHEADHRAKNMLGLVQAVARQTAAGEPENFIRSFSERMDALAANHDLLIRNEWKGVAVADLIRTQLAHFRNLIGVRIALDGPKDLRLKAAACEVIGLALHELATNATKYGALSVNSGRVDVSWGVDGDKFTMTWIEHDGPTVSPPERTGFGSTVITSLPELVIGGEAQLEHAPSGTTWRMTCPAADALEMAESSSPRRSVSAGDRGLYIARGRWKFLPANRSMDLESSDRASVRLENVAAVHDPPQPHQAHAAVTTADAVEAEPEVEPGAGLEAGAGLEVGAQAESEPHDEVEPGSRMRQGNISAASLKSAQAEPDP